MRSGDTEVGPAAICQTFPPTLAGALERIANVRPAHYARSRNSLDGAVTGLSPYITHGFVTTPEVLQGVMDRHPIHPQHKLVYELGWREYFRHVWRTRGDDIFESLHPGVLPDDAYTREMPPDIREARCGIPVIDEAVRTLYATGYLHNHARMWLASYVVHIRKVSWRAGADWLYAHLLDGDLASNHLSWQWVAGTASNKPYLFNADNVARFAPSAWHSPRTVIDTSYEVLDLLARSPRSSLPDALGPGVAEPLTLSEPPLTLRPPLPQPLAIAGRDVWLVHSWDLHEPPPDLPADTLVVGLYLADFHRRWPWSASRWNFVGARMSQLTPLRWFAEPDAAASALAAARSVRMVANPHVDSRRFTTLELRPSPLLFAAVEQPCASFSKWWTHVTRAGGADGADASATA